MRLKSLVLPRSGVDLYTKLKLAASPIQKEVQKPVCIINQIPKREKIALVSWLKSPKPVVKCLARVQECVCRGRLVSRRRRDIVTLVLRILD